MIVMFVLCYIVNENKKMNKVEKNKKEKKKNMQKLGKIHEIFKNNVNRSKKRE